MRTTLNYSTLLLSLLLFTQNSWASTGATVKLLDNPLALTLIVMMILLLIIIGILANVLLGVADLKFKKNNLPIESKVILLIIFLSNQTHLLAQSTENNATTPITYIGGLSQPTFYVFATILFLELFIIITLLINIRFLVQKEKSVLNITSENAEKSFQLSIALWWERFNLFRPVSEEKELDLGHEYDGIRELDNRLPPWWLYGFYISILFAGIYLWRHHVSHSAPSSQEEYVQAVANGEAAVKAYLKLKGESVDENTVSLLTESNDLAIGKKIFLSPGKCATCHGEEGGGNAVGPNLTDDYWIYKGDIKTIFKTVKYGAKNGMKSWKDELSAKEIAQVASFIKSLHGSKPKNAKDPQGSLYHE